MSTARTAVAPAATTATSQLINSFHKQKVDDVMVEEFVESCPFGRSLAQAAAGMKCQAAETKPVAHPSLDAKPSNTPSANAALFEIAHASQNIPSSPDSHKHAAAAAKSPAEHETLPSSPSSAYRTFFERNLQQLTQDGRYRQFANVQRQQGGFPKATYHGFVDGRVHPREPSEITVWCSNDYLGMGQHPKVLQAMHEALQLTGAGSGGTRNISGTNRFHVLLEQELAALHQKESALLFSSCYVANATSLQTLARVLPGVVFLSDAKNHASLIEGIRFSGADKLVFRHNDAAHLEALLRELPLERPKIVVFESVYSMDGTVAPIAEICRLAQRYNALTFLDEVHAVGLYGAHGAGVAERDGISAQVDIISGTLGKAFGVFGGYIAASVHAIDLVRSLAPGFIFTTSLPPVLAAGALASVRHLRESGVERALQQRHARLLKARLAEAGLPVLATPTHIVPLIVGDAHLCKKMSDRLLEHDGIYVQPINAPTVPVGTERFRFTPGPLHTPELIDHLVACLARLFDEYQIPKQQQKKK